MNRVRVFRREPAGVVGEALPFLGSAAPAQELPRIEPLDTYFAQPDEGSSVASDAEYGSSRPRDFPNRRSEKRWKPEFCINKYRNCAHIDASLMEDRRNEERDTMTSIIKTVVGATALAALAGCVEDTGSSAPVNDGLSGTQAQMDAMMEPCMAEARRVTGSPATVIDQMRTGGGPLTVLDVNGQRWSCRMEDDGSVTVFSEFAN